MDCRVCPVHNELCGLQRNNHRQGISQSAEGVHSGNALVSARKPHHWLEEETSHSSALRLTHYPVSHDETSVQAIIEMVNLCNAKQVTRWFRRQKVDQAYLGFIRLVKDEKEQKVVPIVPEKTTTRRDVEKTFHEDVLENIKAVLLDYKDIFSTDLPPRLPPVRMGHEFKIELEDDTPPIHRSICKLSLLELEEASKQIHYRFAHGYIRPSISPHGGPVFFAPKKGGGLRFCIDYCWLNKKTIKIRYPLPLPKELFDRWGGSTIFSNIDLHSRYWQVLLRKDVLADYLDDFVVVLLNDILIYYKTPEDHVVQLKKILQKLQDHELYLKASKCEIAYKSIEFLGQ